MRTILIIVIIVMLAACGGSTAEQLTDVTIRESDLPSRFTPTETDFDSPVAYAFVNGRNAVRGYTVEAPATEPAAALADITPDVVTEPLPDVQLDVIGDVAEGVTYTLDEETFTTRVNAIAFQRDEVLMVVMVSYVDGAASPVDVYKMARLLDRRARAYEASE